MVIFTICCQLLLPFWRCFVLRIRVSAGTDRFLLFRLLIS